MAKAILLGLDGSAQSRYAAEVAWNLAKRHNLTVNAQHVVDSLAAWDFLNFDINGFIGSGPFFAAHEAVRSHLLELGEGLVEAYQAQAAGHEVAGQCFLDEGTTIREVCWRAKDHDFVIYGQRSSGMQNPTEDKRRIPRRSICETLTYYLPKPLLVIQDRCSEWKKLRIMVSDKELELPISLVKGCLSFAAAFGLTAELCVLVEGKGVKSDGGERGNNAITRYQSELPELKKLKCYSQGVATLDSFWEKDGEAEPDVLRAILIVEDEQLKRHCTLQTEPDKPVRYLNYPAVLVWLDTPYIEAVRDDHAEVAGALQKA